MKRRSTALLAVIAAAVLVTVMARDGVGGDSEANSADDGAIRKTVDRYYQGVIAADRKLIESAWDVASGHMKHLRRGAPEDTVAVTPIAQAVDWWTRVKAKTSSSEVLSVDIVDGKLATVKFKFIFDHWDYTEFLTLYKLSGQWKIVNKAFVQKIVEQ